MSEKIVQLNEKSSRVNSRLVWSSVREVLNEPLETKTEKLTQATRYERSEQWQSCRRSLQPQSHHHLRGCHPQGAQTQGNLLRDGNY